MGLAHALFTDLHEIAKEAYALHDHIKEDKKKIELRERLQNVEASLNALKETFKKYLTQFIRDKFSWYLGILNQDYKSNS